MELDTKHPHVLCGHIQKLLYILNDVAAYGRYIGWTQEGRAFKILDENGFVANVLPVLFKTNFLASFQRQLHNYGFKVTRTERLEYSHERFVRGDYAGILSIRRLYPDIRITCKGRPEVFAPVAEAPVAEAPVAEAPVAETCVAETCVAETPQAKRDLRDRQVVRGVKQKMNMEDEGDYTRTQPSRKAKVLPFPEKKEKNEEPETPGYAFGFFAFASEQLLVQCALTDLGEEYAFDHNEPLPFV
jgi:hypothetical protein